MKTSNGIVLANVPLGSYGYLCGGERFKLPNCSANNRANARNRLTVIVNPGTIGARQVELPISLPIRSLED